MNTTMNAENYLEPCENLLQEIMRYSPVTEALIEQIRVQYGSQLAFYAAFVIVCLEARVQQEGYRAVERIKLDDLRSYTFFEMIDTQENPLVLAMFNEALTYYKQACHRRFAVSV